MVEHNSDLKPTQHNTIDGSAMRSWCLDWLISSGSGDNELAPKSFGAGRVKQVLREGRHGFTVCRCSQDQSGAAQGLKGGHRIWRPCLHPGSSLTRMKLKCESDSTSSAG